VKLTKEEFNLAISAALEMHFKKNHGSINIDSLPKVSDIVKEYKTFENNFSQEYVQNYNALVNDICGTLGLLSDKNISTSMKRNLEKQLEKKVESFYLFTKNYTSQMIQDVKTESLDLENPSHAINLDEKYYLLSFRRRSLNSQEIKIVERGIGKEAQKLEDETKIGEVPHGQRISLIGESDKYYYKIKTIYKGKPTEGYIIKKYTRSLTLKPI